MKAAVELMAEATDVIGSQSRQEPGGIKHNLYASAEPAGCTIQISSFSTVRRRRNPLQL